MRHCGRPGSHHSIGSPLWRFNMCFAVTTARLVTATCVRPSDLFHSLACCLVHGGDLVWTERVTVPSSASSTCVLGVTTGRVVTAMS